MTVNDIQFNYVEFINKDSPTSKYKVSRKSFVCLQAIVIPQSDFGQNVFSTAEKIAPKLNTGRAIDATERDSDTVEVDNLSGILAEMVCAEILKHRYGDAIKRDISTTAANQIDIKVSNDKTIEVRSSCIRHGIHFAIFTRRSTNPNEQNVNLVGPYATAYKPGEICKDYYMGVIFPFGIDFFMEQWKRNQPIKMYITGGATKNMMQDSGIYQIKHLTPGEEASIAEESDYHVIPFARSLDIGEFFSTFEYENSLIKIINGFQNEDKNLCCICHDRVSDAVRDYSEKNFKRVLCRKCQDMVRKWDAERKAKKGGT